MIEVKQEDIAVDDDSSDDNCCEEHVPVHRTDAEVKYVSIVMVLIAYLLITVVLCLAYTTSKGRETHVAGYVAVVGASVIFGTTGTVAVAYISYIYATQVIITL